MDYPENAERSSDDEDVGDDYNDCRVYLGGLDGEEEDGSIKNVEDLEEYED